MVEFRTLQSLAVALASHGEAPALIAAGAGATTSFARLSRDSLRLAAGLAAGGVQPGDAVAVLGAAGPDWITAALAVLAARGVLTPLDPMLGDDDLALLLGDCGCRTVFVSAGQRDRLLRIAGAAPQSVILLDEDDGAPADAPHWRRVATDRPLPPGDAEPGDITALFYTSGTTGRPKGVPLSHANLTANLRALGARRLIGPGDRVLLPLPLHHVYPLVVGALTPLAAGVAVAFPGGLSGPEIAGALQDSRATVLIAVPRLCAALRDAILARIALRRGPAGRIARGLLALTMRLPPATAHVLGRLAFRRIRTALSPHLRLLVSGGARLDPEDWRGLEALGWNVLTGYGLTETAPVLTFNTPGAARIGTAGRPLAGVELRIEDAGDHRLGEILARGPGVFAGYRNLPDETAAAFTADGWFRTGDLGFIDADGYLHIEGRSKELIVLPDGKNVFPETVEAAYAESPFIREVAVLEHGGALAGLVVPDLEAVRAHGAESLDGLIRGALHQASIALPAWQRIAGHAVTREALPRTTIGKLRRHMLPGLYDAARGRAAPPAPKEPSPEDRALLATPPADDLWRWLQRRFAGTALSMDTSPQLDLGVDSLAWTGLSLEIEDRFAIRIGEARIARIITLRDLLREAVAAAAEGPAEPAAPRQGPRLAPAHGAVLHALHTVLYHLNRGLIRALFPLRVSGLEHLPASGPFIIAPNHLSYLDALVISAALPLETMRRVWFAGWTGLMFQGPVSRVFSRIVQVFPVDADRAAAHSLELARAVLRGNHIMIWFPEGERSVSGALQPFHPGIGVLLLESGVPAVPTRIAGTFEAAPRGRVIPRRHAIGLAFGAAEPPEALEEKGRGETAAARVADGLREAVAALVT